MRLNACAFGLAFGIIWAIAIFIVAIIGIWSDWCSGFLEMMSSIYIGTSATWGGAFIGLVWGFVDGFIGAWLVALLYNCFVGKPKTM